MKFVLLRLAVLARQFFCDHEWKPGIRGELGVVYVLATCELCGKLRVKKDGL